MHFRERGEYHLVIFSGLGAKECFESGGFWCLGCLTLHRQRLLTDGSSFFIARSHLSTRARHRWLSASGSGWLALCQANVVG